MEDDMAEDIHLWRMGGDGRLLPVYILIIIKKITLNPLNILQKIVYICKTIQYSKIKKF